MIICYYLINDWTSVTLFVSNFITFLLYNKILINI